LGLDSVNGVDAGDISINGVGLAVGVPVGVGVGSGVGSGFGFSPDPVMSVLVDVDTASGVGNPPGKLGVFTDTF
jgi:hypothetical protein